jgi:hypothetical protein
MLNDRSQSRSQRPKPLAEGDADHNAPATRTRARTRPRSNAEKIQALVVLYVLTLNAEERAYLQSLISAEAARKLAADKNPQAVFDALVGALETFAPWITAGKLPGFGPRRGSFAFECAKVVAQPLTDYAKAATAEKVAAHEAAHTLTLTEPARQDALCAMQSLLGGDSSVRARLSEQGVPDTSRDSRIQSADHVAQEAEAARAHIPASLLEDAGLTSPVLDSLSTKAQSAADAHTGYRRGRVERQALRGDLAEAVGRMRFELKQLLTSARQARKRDPSIPSFTTKVVGAHAKSAKKPAAKPATPQPPQSPTG